MTKTELSTGKIKRSLQRFRDFSNDLAKSDLNTFADRLKLLMEYCESDQVLQGIHRQLLSIKTVDFNSWYEKGKSTAGGMVGSAELKFPTNLEDRMAIMYQLLYKINKEEIDFFGFCHYFFVTSDTKYNTTITAFNKAIVEPLARELSYRIEDIEENMPKDNKEQYPLANIQIIHNANNVIQQSARGKNISQDASIEKNTKVEDLFNKLNEEAKNKIRNKEELSEALQVIETSKELSAKGKNGLPSIKVLLGSLTPLGNMGSIISAIFTVLATIA